MSNRGLAVLLVLFFAGLGAIWLRPSSRPAPEAVAGGSALPALFPSVPAEVDRVEIDGDSAGRIVLERTGTRRWECREPERGLASASRIEALLLGLSQLRPLQESGVLDGPASRYGLEPPRRVLRVFEEDEEAAVLNLGATVAGTAYVRVGEGPIVPVDASLAGLVDQPNSYWREPQLIPIQSWLDVRSLSIQNEGRTLRMERNASGVWRFVEPTKAPVETQTLLNVIVRLAVAQVGEAVAEAEAKGLESPWLRVIVTTEKEGEWGFSVGEEVAGRPEWYAVRRDGDTEVVSVPTEILDVMPMTPEAFRSHRAMVFRPDRVRALAVIEGGREHLVIRDEAMKWRLERPDRAPADAKVVNDLLKTLSDLDTVAIFAPKELPNSGVDTPEAVVKLWLGDPWERKIPKPDDPGDRSIAVGRRDAGRKQVYARTGGDTSILALLETFPAEIPRGDLAFRNRTIQAMAPGTIAKIAVEQGGRTDVVVAGEEPGDYSRWRMERPLAARVDTKAVATLDLLLSRLRASSLVDTGDATVDPARFGLDDPVVRVSWTLRPGTKDVGNRRGTLRVGNAVAAGEERRYASLDGRPGVFTLEPRAISILTAELHERTVLSYPPEEVTGVTLRWPGRPAWVVERRPRAFEGVDWVTVSGTGPEGLPVADLAPMVARLALLSTERFAQYGGRHRPEFGLETPAVSVEVSLSEGLGTRLLRIGARGPGKSRYAASGTGESGAVFYVPEEPWAAWLNPPGASPGSAELPERVFAPGG